MAKIDAIEAPGKAEATQDLAAGLLAEAQLASRNGRIGDAERAYRQIVDLAPDHALAHCGLAWTRQMLGDADEAVAQYRLALSLAPEFAEARRRLALLLVGLGRRDESLVFFEAEMRYGGLTWFNEVISAAMRDRDLSRAGVLVDIMSGLRWGSRWHPADREGLWPAVPDAAPSAPLTIAKLEHDIAQFRFLQARGALDDTFTPIIEVYESERARLVERDVHTPVPMDETAKATIGHVYNRIVHVRPSPRVARALSGRWDPLAVENRYLNEPPGVVVVDDFLSPDALSGLHRFCLESTIWSSNRHPHGRLGALFRDGFNSPLLLQIAEELREALPRVIGERYPLRHMWGYKTGASLEPETTTHADFAAVNVNFWITPDDANLEPGAGGLVVYGVDAPMHWDFHTYNARLEDVIKPFLRRQKARAITIPYRQNRAVIFNSDLFHATDRVRFREGYENYRINVTMLYGDREDDVHHRGLSRPETNGDEIARSEAWRSAAFSGLRRR